MPKPFLVLDQHSWLLWAVHQVHELHLRDEAGQVVDDESLGAVDYAVRVLLRIRFARAGAAFAFLLSYDNDHTSSSSSKKKTVAARNPAGGGEHQHV